MTQLKLKDKVFYRKHTLNLGGKILDLSVPRIMGILNVTPDSFYDGGKNGLPNLIIEKAGKMMADGASILDVGGYSSRPNALHVSEQEEIDRVVPAIRLIKKEFPNSVISIDTFRAKVAQRAIDAGAVMINDISGGELDLEMFQTVAKNKVPYVLMHMKGTPQNMQSYCNYDSIHVEILDYFQKKLYKLHDFGVNDVVLDVGIGFAKTLEQNFELLDKLKVFEILSCPLLVGISRKSLIYNTLGCSVNESLNGTTALNMVALQNGANIIRVHDVKEAFETVKLNSNLGVLN
jgi:dihydropteroate synthase